MSRFGTVAQVFWIWTSIAAAAAVASVSVLLGGPSNDDVLPLVLVLIGACVAIVVLVAYRWSNYVTLELSKGALTVTRWRSARAVLTAEIRCVAFPANPSGFPRAIVLELTSGETIRCPFWHTGPYSEPPALTSMERKLDELEGVAVRRYRGGYSLAP